MKTRFLLISIFLFSPLIATAQVQIFGVYDFEIRKGSEDSRLWRNGVPNDNLHFGVYQLQLFLDAPISDNISFFGKISNNTARGWGLKELEVQLAYVTFNELFDTGLNLAAGRILTPFGAYSKRQLSPDNPHIGQPLFFQWLNNISPSFGYLDPTTTPIVGSSYGGRIGSMYTGGYYTGTKLFGSFMDEKIEYDLALMNAPLSSAQSDLNQNSNIAFHGRVAVQPVIWAKAGFSYAGGAFMEENEPNQILSDLEQYRQQTIGFDLLLEYLYYEFHAEYLVNRWNSPYITLDYSASPPYTSGLNEGEELVLTNNELLLDLKINAPFYPGLYIAGRYNMLNFGNITDPFAGSATAGEKIQWGNDLSRYAVTIGFKPVRRVVVKASYEKTVVDVSPAPDVSFFGVQVSVSM